MAISLTYEELLKIAVDISVIAAAQRDEEARVKAQHEEALLQSVQEMSLTEAEREQRHKEFLETLQFAADISFNKAPESATAPENTVEKKRGQDKPTTDATIERKDKAEKKETAEKKERKEQLEQLEQDELTARRLAGEWNGKKPQTIAEMERDEEIARRLADEFLYGNESERKAASELQHKERKEADESAAAVAARMQHSEGSYAREAQVLTQYKELHQKRTKLPGDTWKKMEALLREILSSPACAGEELGKNADFTDAHKYTTTLIRAGLPVLCDIDKQFNLSDETLEVSEIEKEILSHVEFVDPKKETFSVENIKKSFARIPGGWEKEASAAGETQADVRKVLSRAWSLAKKTQEGYMEKIALCLSHNIGDSGGCIPGLIARLYSPYANMVAHKVDVSVSKKKDAAPAAPAKKA